MTLSVGDVLDNKYKILKLLGRGALGDVYLAENQMLDREVAIKHLRLGSAHEQTIERFLTEVRTIAKIKHENVLAVHDAIEEDGINYYLVMEYANEGTVADLVQREGQLSIPYALKLGLAVTQALEVVHANNILHGDIKPSNILLVSDNDEVQVKLADFGLSRAMIEAETSIFSGSLLYSAPEQFGGERVDQRTDLYALGATLYEMLTGQPPFPYSGKAEDLTQVIVGHREKTPTPPSELNPKVSPMVNRVVLKALSKTPDERYSDAQTMEYVLRQTMEAHEAWRERVQTAYAQGVKHERRKEWERAIACYEDVLEEQPGHTEAQERLAHALERLDWEAQYKEGLQAYDQGDWAQVVQILSQVVAYDENYAGGDAADKLEEAQRQLELKRIYEEAKGCEAKEQWSEAASLYIKILTKESDYKDAPARLAHVDEQQKCQTLYKSAREYMENQIWGEAVKTLQELGRLKPDYKDSSVLLSEARRQKRLQDLYTEAVKALNDGDSDSAFITFSKLLMLDPEYRDAAAKRALIEREKGLIKRRGEVEELLKAEQWEDAIRELKEIKEIASSYQEVDRLLEEATRKQKIAKLYEDAVRSYEQERWEQAIQRLEELQRLQPGYQDVIQRLEEAKKSRRVQTHYAQARHFEMEEDWTEAVRAYSEVIELDPGHENARAGLARVSATALGKGKSSSAERRERAVAVAAALLIIAALSYIVFVPLSHIAADVIATATPPLLCDGKLDNGGFERKFECWQRGGELDQDVKCERDQCYAILGNPDYPCEGGVPVGDAWIKQTVKVPQEISPTLSLRYRVFSHDLDLPGCDCFQVTINGESLHQYGNYEWLEPSCDRAPWDSEWQTLTLGLDAYRGKEIEISFHNSNENSSYNTWTYVDDVRIGKSN